jgi:hypothetical protein
MSGISVPAKNARAATRERNNNMGRGSKGGSIMSKKNLGDYIEKEGKCKILYA